MVTHYNDATGMRQLCVICRTGDDSGAATLRARIGATHNTQGQLPAQRRAPAQPRHAHPALCGSYH